MKPAAAVSIVHDFWSTVWNPPYDLDAIDRFVTDDFVLTAGGDEIVSREAFKEWVAAFLSKVTDLRLEPVESFANGDGSRVTSQWIVTGRNNGVFGTAPDQQPIRLTGTAVWTVREDGRLLHNRVERSSWELYARLGDGQRPLVGTTTLVTGASGGIGAATALAIARQGGAVALVARRADRLNELTTAIGELGGSSIAISADLSDAAQAERVVRQAVGRFGRLDVLVNNAGLVAPDLFEDGDPGDWEKMVDINLQAVLRMSGAALPHLMIAAAEGHRKVADLVTVSSVAGRWPRKGNSVYSATKHAVVGFSEALRQEVTGRGVRVGLIEPGMTGTEMTQDRQDVLSPAMPPESWLRAEDVARSIIFMITQPPHTAVNEIVVRPTAQEH